MGSPERPGSVAAARANDDQSSLSRALLERLALYYQIATRMGEAGRETISSAVLASPLSVDPTLVRKDMAQVSITGRPKVGYQIATVLKRLDEVLGLSSRKDAILIGCGHLGAAIVAYPGFAQYGLKISAVFDNDYKKVGQLVGGHVVLPMEKCKAIIENFRIEIAILTVPATVAQELATWLERRGIRAIWNFSPVQLQHDDRVVVRNENLAQGLAQLIHHFKQFKAHSEQDRRVPE
jgi:redox-sensing transcriptional repressor